jgi:hypothetical protein
MMMRMMMNQDQVQVLAQDQGQDQNQGQDQVQGQNQDLHQILIIVNLKYQIIKNHKIHKVLLLKKRENQEKVKHRKSRRLSPNQKILIKVRIMPMTRIIRISLISAEKVKNPIKNLKEPQRKKFHQNKKNIKKLKMMNQGQNLNLHQMKGPNRIRINNSKMKKVVKVIEVNRKIRSVKAKLKGNKRAKK